MSFNPVTDFLGLWRNVAGQVSKMEMPGLDYVVQALARAGFITLSVSATAPVANQPTTAWLQTAVPSYSAEGVLFLWEPVAATYVPATAALFFEMLQAATGQNGVSWWAAAGGPPINTVGNNGDFSLRTDEPGGIYGPKIAGAWPANPLSGTTDIIGSTQLDQTFGVVEGTLIVRGPAVWQPLAIGAANTVFYSPGPGNVPGWSLFSNLLDIIGSTQGDILYRNAAGWAALAPGVANQILSSGGPAANPSWANRTTEFPSGTVMLFQQSAAPPGWTKQTALNDCGLRVTSGAISTVGGSAFSSVFAQSAVGNTTITVATMPSHNHPVSGASTTTTAVAAAGHAFADQTTLFTSNTGGDGAHAHSVNLTLAYTDVIIATKN